MCISSWLSGVYHKGQMMEPGYYSTTVVVTVAALRIDRLIFDCSTTRCVEKREDFAGLRSAIGSAVDRVHFFLSVKTVLYSSVPQLYMTLEDALPIAHRPALT